MKEYNLIIVGGGAAGILCAIEANKQGIDNILLIEKDKNTTKKKKHKKQKTPEIDAQCRQY